MTREEYSRTLRYMEHLRLGSYDEGPSKAREMMLQYQRLAASIQPYVEGRMELDDDNSSLAKDPKP